MNKRNNSQLQIYSIVFGTGKASLEIISARARSMFRQCRSRKYLKSIHPDRLRWVGVVDTVRKDRLGVAAEWPSIADEAVRIWRRNWFACISGATVPKRDEPRG